MPASILTPPEAREMQKVSSVIILPIDSAQAVEMRYSLLSSRDQFDPSAWSTVSLKPSSDGSACMELDLSKMNLRDGSYEYEFVLDGDADHPVADPYAEEITRFGGYRGVFHIKDGERQVHPFFWQDELSPTKPLVENNALAIYEMPLRWMSMPQGETPRLRQFGLGTFDEVIFEHLDDLAELGINAIELLPIQDSPDTLNWGYGTRFFFAPDIDMGTPVDLKFFIKACHQRGIRVFLDVVMNHARECPMEALAERRFFLINKDEEEPGRGDDYGARLFRYRAPSEDGIFWAREFHFQMAEFWIRNYHIDGFRIDEFRGIDNWDFIQTFRYHAWRVHKSLFPARPFLVIAEDSARRAMITQQHHFNPNGRQVVDSMWNFAFRDEARRLMRDQLFTQFGEPSRSQRVQWLLSANATWNDFNHQVELGFSDLSQAVNYITSHDVEAVGEQRYLNDVFGRLLVERNLADDSVDTVSNLVNSISGQSPEIRQAHQDALEQVRSAFALLYTAVGIPMVLAGEEFADVHDLENSDWRLKMSDPIDWYRSYQPGHSALRSQVSQLIKMRTSHAALQRNEISFFYFHPGMDANDGERVFAYCRTANKPLGSPGQVMVVVNASGRHYPQFVLPWHWGHLGSSDEIAQPLSGAPTVFNAVLKNATFSLAPFQARVFVS